MLAIKNCAYSPKSTKRVRNRSLEYASHCREETERVCSNNHDHGRKNVFFRVNFQRKRAKWNRTRRNWFHRHAETNHAEFIPRGKLFAPKRPRPVLHERLLLRNKTAINRADRGANKFYTRLEPVCHLVARTTAWEKPINCLSESEYVRNYERTNEERESLLNE